jgi:LacI family transcriptional regulator, galactose operon repressor
LQNRKPDRPTILHVAHVAHVSKSTAARALSGATNIRPETRARVLAAAKSVGYEANQLAKSLRSGRTGMFGLVIPDIANPFWAEVARGAQDRAAQNDASLLIFSSDWKAAREASHLRALRKARVDGAIVNPVEDSIDALGRFGTPVVLIGSSAERFPELPSVGSDIAQGVRLGLNHLLSLGHTDPAILAAPIGRLARARFMRVVHDFFVERGRDPAGLLVEDGEYTVDSGKAAMRRLLARTTRRPLCVFAANDLMALGAMLAVREAGLLCPQDVSILGFDGIPAGVFSHPSLSTIAKPARQIGDRAMGLLLERVRGHASPNHMVLPCEMVARASLSDLSGGRRGQLTATG